MTSHTNFRHKATMEQYKEHADMLKFLRAYALKLDIELCNTYGNAYTIGRVTNRIDKVRSILEDRMFAEHPNEADPKIFYGRRV